MLLVKIGNKMVSSGLGLVKQKICPWVLKGLRPETAVRK
jgi:hypothetical protein